MAKIKIRRINREELPGASILRDAVAADIGAFPLNRGVLDLDMEIDPNLRQLFAHDPDGFFTAIDRDETLGFVASHVRSRQCVLSEFWVLPQHQRRGAGDALLERVMIYGHSSGAREYMAIVPAEPNVQAVLLRHGFEAITPVYVFSVSTATATTLASALTGLLPGSEVSTDLYQRRGQADLDRLDRVTRNITRDVDHMYWLKERGFKATFVQQGQRVGAYAYAGAGQIGPIAGSTQEAALSGIGWALQMALAADTSGDFELRVPAPFTSAVETLIDAGANLDSTFLLYGRGLSLSFDRMVFGPVCLP